MPENLYRRVALKQFVENGELLIDIPRTHDIESIKIVVDGTLTISVAAATSVPVESPTQLIRRADFTANGKDVLHSAGFTELSLGNYARKFINLNTKPGTTVAAHPVRLVGFMDRVNFDGPRPKDTAFQAYLTNLLQLRLLLGSHNDIIVKGGATLAFTGNVEVWVYSINETQDKGEARFVKKITEQSEQFTGANSALSFDLPRGNYIRSLIIHVEDNDVPDDTLVNSIEYNINGTDVRLSATWEDLRDLNKGFKLIQSMPPGFAVVDSSPDGKLSNLYNLVNADESKLLLDVNAPAGTGRVTVTIEEIIFPGG